MSENVIIAAIICFTIICVVHIAAKVSIIQIQNEKEVTKDDDQS